MMNRRSLLKAIGGLLGALAFPFAAKPAHVDERHVVRLGDDNEYAPGHLHSLTTNAIAVGDWVDGDVPYVMCRTVPGGTGDYRVWLPRHSKSQDPAVFKGDHLVVYQDINTDNIAISSYLDDCIGTIKGFNGLLSLTPKGWALCDGSNGTVDLRYKFVTNPEASIALAYIQRVA